MDCHDVRSLLPFTRKGSDQIDAAERAAIQQHLDACPDCAAATQAEAVFDAAVGPVLRDVPVPAGLKERVLAKLAANRPRPWGMIAAAAAVLLVLGIGASMLIARTVPFGRSDVDPVALSADEIEAWYKKHGVETSLYRRFDYSLLWSQDIVEIKGKRVPKLIFYHAGKGAIAEIIVLRESQFDIADLKANVDVPGDSRQTTLRQNDDYPDYWYVVSTRGAKFGEFTIDGN